MTMLAKTSHYNDYLVEARRGHRPQLNNLRQHAREGLTLTESNRRCQALQEYCDIGLSWLDMLGQLDLPSTIRLDRERTHDLIFLNIVTHASSLSATAAETYPTAASTTFFHEMVVLPPAYFAASFATDHEVRTRAMALMRRTAPLDPNTQPQLYTTIVPFEPIKIMEKDDGHQDMFQAHCVRYSRVNYVSTLSENRDGLTAGPGARDIKPLLLKSSNLLTTQPGHQ